MRHWIYAKFMRLAHRYNWHHISTFTLENGDVQNWCHWCGLRETLKRDHFMGMKINTDLNCPKNTIILTNIQVPKNYGH